jgi:hypothetical protein
VLANGGVIDSRTMRDSLFQEKMSVASSECREAWGDHLPFQVTAWIVLRKMLSWMATATSTATVAQ